ncbi:MAG: TonB-dependent receptor, partial [bacterium]
LYQLPFGKQGGFASHVIRNWQLSGIFSAQTGQPLSATLSTDPSGTSTTARPNRIADGNLPPDQRSRTQWFNTAAFIAPGCVCFGNSGRDILRGPGFMDLDLGIARDFLFAERFRLQFRAESFNLMNHPNFGLPNSAIGNPGVGIITTTINPERQNQLALKLYF